MKMYADSFDDNCYELTTLRWFRDTYVSKDDIDKYYNIAPRIVKKSMFLIMHQMFMRKSIRR